VLEPVDAALDRGRREADLAADLGQRPAAVGDEDRDDLLVQGVRRAKTMRAG
jgi:hypothetical protein